MPDTSSYPDTNENTALLDQPLPINAPCCEKCGAPTHDFAVCRACGYYAKLGEFVEIDHEMEGFEIEKEPEPFKLPKWTTGLFVVCFAIIAEAVTLSFVFPVDSLERLTCSILHMSIGLFLLLYVQVRSTFLAMMDDLSVKALDCVACPPKAWGAVFKRLPGSSRLITMFSAGIVCVLMSAIVLRAIPYYLLFSNEPAPEYKSTLIADVLSSAPESKGDAESLEEAVQSFADKGDQDLDGTGATALDLPTETYNVRSIVIGFNLTQTAPQTVSSIIVATSNRNPLSTEKWRVLGSIPITEPKMANLLLDELSDRIQTEPITKTELRATWVKPSVKCEVMFNSSDPEEPPSNLELKRLF